MQPRKICTGQTLLLCLQVLKRASEGIFVPLTVGGGIRSFTDANGTAYSALEVASEYFRCLPCSALLCTALLSQTVRHRLNHRQWPLQLAWRASSAYLFIKCKCALQVGGGQGVHRQ